jgi:hypothetical protein
MYELGQLEALYERDVPMIITPAVPEDLGLLLPFGTKHPDGWPLAASINGPNHGLTKT